MRKFHRAPSGLYVPRSQAGFIHPGLLSNPVGLTQQVAFTTFSTGTGTGNLNITTSESWTPVAALFLGVTLAGTNTFNWIFGATDGSSEWVHAHSLEDNDSTADQTHCSSASACFGAVLNTGTFVGLADFNQWLTGGVRLTITNAFPVDTSGIAIFFGPDWDADCGIINPNDTQNGSTTITTGHESALVFLSGLGAGHGFPASSLSECEWSFGAWDGSNQRCFTYRSTFQTNPTQNAVFGRNDRAGASVADFSNFELGNGDSNSFDCITRDASANSGTRLGYLSLAKDNVDVHVGDFTSETDTGVQSYTHVGFRPQFLLTLDSLLSAFNSLQTGDETDWMGACVITAGGTVQRGIANEDNVSTSNVFLVTSTSRGYYSREADSFTPEITAADFDGFTATGFDLDYTQADGAARKSISIAIG